MRTPFCTRLGGVCLGGMMLVWAGAALAVCTSTDECLNAIDRAQRDTQTVAADFVQVKHLNLLDEPLVSSGALMLKRPDHVLVRIDKPQAVTVRINGGQLDMPNLSPADRQALSMAPIASLFADLGAMFSGSLRALQDKFDVSARGEDDGIGVRLVPRQEAWKQSFRSIGLHFQGPELLIHTVVLDDALGDNIDITLTNVRRNVDLPDSLFTAAAG